MKIFYIIKYDLLRMTREKTALILTFLQEQELYNQAKNSEVIVGFIIPSDFGKQFQKGNKPEIKVVKLPSSNDSGVVEGIIRSTYAKLNAENSVRLYFNEQLKNSSILNKDVVISESSQKVDEYLKKPPLVSIDPKVYGQKKHPQKWI